MRESLRKWYWVNLPLRYINQAYSLLNKISFILFLLFFRKSRYGSCKFWADDLLLMQSLALKLLRYAVRHQNSERNNYKVKRSYFLGARYVHYKTNLAFSLFLNKLEKRPNMINIFTFTDGARFQFIFYTIHKYVLFQ